MTTQLSKLVRSVLLQLPDPSTHQKFLGIRLDNLTGSIRKNILGRLSSINVETIQDLINMVVVDFLSLKGLWSRLAEELVNFREKVISDPKSILSLYDSNQPTVLFITSHNSLVDSFKSLINSYFCLQPNRESQIFYKRLSFGGEQKITLQEIGLEFKVSRERIRQIVEVSLSDLLQLMNGDVVRIRKQNYKCSEEGVSLLNKVKLVLTSKPYFIREEFLSQLTSEGIVTTYLPSDEPYLNLLLEMLCPQAYDFNSSKVLITEDKEYAEKVIPDLNNLSDKIREVLNKYPTLMKDTDLLKKANKTFRNLDLELLGVCCSSDNTIETIKRNQSNYYQIKLEYLRSLNSCIYRVLHTHNKPMHTKEIYSLLSHTREFNNSNWTSPHKAVSNRIHTDGRFQAIGKMGLWALSSWNVNTQYLDDLVKDALLEIGKPASLKDIYKFVSKKRPDIKYPSMACILTFHKDTFAYTTGHLLTLKAWTQYPIVESSRVKTLPGHVIDKAIISVFSKHKKLDADQLYSLLIKEGLNINRRNVTTRANNSPLLKKETINSKNFYSLVEGGSPRSSEPLARDLMIKSAKDLIRKSTLKKLKLSEIVSSLESSHGFNRYSVYGVINPSNGFRKETVGPKDIWVTLKDFS